MIMLKRNRLGFNVFMEIEIFCCGFCLNVVSCGLSDNIFKIDSIDIFVKQKEMVKFKGKIEFQVSIV